MQCFRVADHVAIYGQSHRGLRSHRYSAVPFPAKMSSQIRAPRVRDLSRRSLKLCFGDVLPTVAPASDVVQTRNMTCGCLRDLAGRLRQKISTPERGGYLSFTNPVLGQFSITDASVHVERRIAALHILCCKSPSRDAPCRKTRQMRRLGACRRRLKDQEL